MENGYTWVIKVTIDPDVVAGGFCPTSAFQWEEILLGFRFINAPTDDVEVEVIDAPDLDRIRKEQGYTDTVPDTSKED